MPNTTFIPGALWPDSDGRHIHAHGGGILLHNGVYYWYGEDKSHGTSQNHVGVSCYSSRDLLNWKRQSTCLPREAMPPQFQAPGVLERPKVIYCPKTGKFVMWMHLEEAGSYHFASAGIATANAPEGPFVFDRAFRPIQYDFGCPENDRSHQRERGPTYRDMNLFVDDDGLAYVLYAAEDNKTLYIARLNETFTDVVRPAIEGQTWSRNFVGMLREGPAPFKHNGRYYLFSSGCSGWQPNPAMIASADQMLGPWTVLGDPCLGPDADTTFYSQSTFVIPAPGKPKGCFIYLGDRWCAARLNDSRYIWLPFVLPSTLRPENPVTLEFLPEWDLSIYDARGAIADAPVLAFDGEELTWRPVPNAAAYRVLCNGRHIGATTATRFRPEPMLAGLPLHYEVVAFNLEGNTSPRSNPVVRASVPRSAVALGDVRPDAWKAAYITPYRNLDMNRAVLQTEGAEHRTGICHYAPGELHYNVNGAYRRLRVRVGMRKGERDSCRFRIVGDGRELAASAICSPSGPAATLTADLSGIQRVSLIADGSGVVIWGDAVLEMDC